MFFFNKSQAVEQVAGGSVAKRAEEKNISKGVLNTSRQASGVNKQFSDSFQKVVLSNPERWFLDHRLEEIEKSPESYNSNELYTSLFQTSMN